MRLRKRAERMKAVVGFSASALCALVAILGCSEPSSAPGGSEVERPARVTRVVDGDTLVVLIEGREERVRLLGIDTPELPREERRGQYLAEEAAALARDLALGQRVLLRRDPQRKDRDDYGRLLRYVRLPDGRLLNAELLRRGYAHVFTRYPFERQEEFSALEAAARERGLGLWAARGVAEVEWNLAHGLAPVQLHPTTNWSWAIEYEGWIKTGVPVRDLAHELGRLRGSIERGDPAALGDRLLDEGYARVQRERR